MVTNKVYRYIFLALCSLFAFFGNVVPTFACDTQSKNEAIAHAYKIAIENFINELKLREDDKDNDLQEFMASFGSYLSEVREDGDGFCISFYPKEFKGGPVLGGGIKYCFDSTGTVLKRVSKDR